MKKLIAIAGITVMLAGHVLADLAPAPGKPSKNVKKPPTVSSDMDIRLDSTATEAKLIIPASQLKQLRAELDSLDSDTNAAAFTGGSTDSFAKTQTIVSGLFLSIAIVLGGLWVSRNRKIVMNARALGILAVLAAFGSAATLVYANIGPPPDARGITGKMFSQSVHTYGQGGGKVKLESGDGKRILLVVPNPKTETRPAE